MTNVNIRLAGKVGGRTMITVPQRIWAYKEDIEKNFACAWTQNRPTVDRSKWIEFRRVVKRKKKKEGKNGG